MTPAPVRPIELSRAVEDLRAPYQALLMASSGIAAAMHVGTASEDGVYFLLDAVAKQMEASIVQLERLAGIERT